MHPHHNGRAVTAQLHAPNVDVPWGTMGWAPCGWGGFGEVHVMKFVGMLRVGARHIGDQRSWGPLSLLHVWSGIVSVILSLCGKWRGDAGWGEAGLGTGCFGWGLSGGKF